MDSNEKDIELIDQYLQGDLSDEEIQLFEERLINDQDFVTDFNFVKDLKQGIKLNERKSLKQKLAKISSEYPLGVAAASYVGGMQDDEYFEQPAASMQGDSSAGAASHLYVKIAATVAIIIGFSGLFYTVHNQLEVSPSQLSKSNSSSDQLEFSNQLAEKSSIHMQLDSANQVFQFNTEKVSSSEFGFTGEDSLQVIVIVDTNLTTAQYFFSDSLYLLFAKYPAFLSISKTLNPPLYVVSCDTDTFVVNDSVTVSINPLKKAQANLEFEEDRRFIVDPELNFESRERNQGDTVRQSY